MASRHTEHYGLSQWEASDKVERTDFNADNAAGGRGAPRAGTVQGGDRRPLPALRPCGPEGGPDRPGGAGGAAGQQGGSGGPERRGAPPVSRGGLHAPHRLRQLHRKRDQRPRVPCLPRLFLPAPAFGGAPLRLLPPTAPACSSSGASPREAAWGTSTSMSMSPGREIRSPGTPQRTTPPPR